MVIAKAGCRVRRGSTPSSSSGDGDFQVKKRIKPWRVEAKPNGAAAFDRSEGLGKDTELCQVGDIRCSLPLNLFELTDLEDILSLDVWNYGLTEEERERLCSFLPDMDQETYKRTLTELFGGKNFYFGSPVAELLRRLKDGLYHPIAVQYQEALRFLQRKEHCHHLREYHNGIVQLIVDMQSVWWNHSNADIDERLEIWNAWNFKPESSSEADENRGQSKTVMPQTSCLMGRVGVHACEEVDVNLAGGSTKLLPEGSVLTVPKASSSRRVRMPDPTRGGILRKTATQRDDENIPMSGLLLESHSVHGVASNSAEHTKPGNWQKRKDAMGTARKVAPGNKHVQQKNNEDREERSGSKHSNVKFRSDKQVIFIANQIDYETSDDSQLEVKNGFSGKKLLCGDDEDDQLAYLSFSDPKRKRTSKGDYSSEVPKRWKGCDDKEGRILVEQCNDLVDKKSLRKAAGPAVPPSTEGFSFSILHLLSAVRMALLGYSEPWDSNNSSELYRTGNLTCGNDDEQVSLGVSFRDLVRRVHASPGDCRVLEAREPLEGLVRGVLKVLSCKAIEHGMKGLRPLVTYNKVNRCWSWTGPSPDPYFSFDSEDTTSADAWCIPQKMLRKFQDAFTSWLKSAQVNLRLLGQLGLPPLPSTTAPVDVKERFRELRAQKSLVTINPTSHEMRAYFQRQEAVRYSIPDIAFTYFNTDGQRCAVPPLRRVGGKFTAKARDHFMLKADRPSHVTILCLVRDAAARLPHGTGTRADVCALIRDSQYIVDEVSDLQLNQVVSGALDRLHYERDPCVRYDGEKKLWVYLHADREEEDFEDNGTSSTKRWKRVKKDATDMAELHSSKEHGQLYTEGQDIPELGYNSPSRGELDSGDLSCFYPSSAGTPELLYNHHAGSLSGTPMMLSGFPGQQAREDSILPLIELPPSIQPRANMQSHPMGWEVYR